MNKEAEKWNKIDSTIIDLSRDIRTLFYVGPINVAVEKEKFMASSNSEPSFEYKEPDYNAREKENVLGFARISVPEGKLHDLFVKKIDGLTRNNNIIGFLGREAVVRSNSMVLYGAPSNELVEYSEGLLRDLPKDEAPKIINALEVKRSLEQALQEFGLNEWQVEYSDKRLTTVDKAKKIVTICENRKFSQRDPFRLAVHEVGVHVLRSANGFEQPIKIFGTSLPGYLTTEEGMTSYFEEQTGNSSPENLRDYAGRVIAVDSVVKALSFRQTYDRLRDNDVNGEQAWNLSVRAHRAGGFIKDHVYLEGLLKVREFASDGGDFKELYVGKVGIKDLPLVRELVSDGVLNEAKYLPSFLQEKP